MSASAGHDRDAGDVVDGLVQTSFTVIALLSQVATAHELSLTQLRVLAILRDREPKIAELAAFLGLERSSVSGLVDRSVARGLVRRAPSADDGRVVRVTLTERGRRFADALTEEFAGLLAPMTDRLGRAGRTRLATLLAALQQ
jgi:DNA-binding MarR family transcriptional regulator